MNDSKIRLFAFLLLFCIISCSINAQEIVPKREFRGAWIATVANIDFPSTPGISRDKFNKEWISTLDFLEQTGLNAVFVQVRPSGDAFYPSKIAPWSKYLTGGSGKPPREKFDPMKTMIDETHQRGMEFHAWLNPYRASTDTLVGNLSKTHPYHSHPEWFVQYGGKLYFNPALPEVRNYITEIVLEIIMEYDVDGIHFDDYFYPYPAAGELLPDAEDFAKFGYGYLTIDDWRRSNVNALISQISSMIKTISPHVKFGVSPFGVWRNKSQDSAGSNTRAGISAYDDLFADVRFWLEKGWVDYVAPQLYWQIGFQIADYEQLLDWWHKNSFDKHVYTGNAIYKVGNHADPAWRSPDQIPLQVSLNRIFPNIQGNIFYNTNSLKKNLLGVSDSLRLHYFEYPAIWPEMKYLNLPEPGTPSLGKASFKKGVLKMKCRIPKGAYNLIVYRFDDRRPGDYNNPANILKIIRTNGVKTIFIEDRNIEDGKNYAYAVSATNRQHTESLLSDWRGVEVRKNRIKRIK